MMRLLRQARRLSVAPIRKMRPADGKPGKLKPRRKAKARLAPTPSPENRLIDERAGTLHVHFPRIGFQIRKDKLS